MEAQNLNLYSNDIILLFELFISSQWLVDALVHSETPTVGSTTPFLNYGF
jgi:hypothetical protein